MHTAHNDVIAQHLIDYFTHFYRNGNLWIFKLNLINYNSPKLIQNQKRKHVKNVCILWFQCIESLSYMIQSEQWASFTCYVHLSVVYEKIIFEQSSNSASGVHEWTKKKENWKILRELWTFLCLWFSARKSR